MQKRRVGVCYREHQIASLCCGIGLSPSSVAALYQEIKALGICVGGKGEMQGNTRIVGIYGEAEPSTAAGSADVSSLPSMG